MFGLSMTEIILIVVVALVVIGPKKLPDIAKSIGKGYGEFRRNLNDLKQSVDINAAPASKKNSPSEEKKDYAEQYKSQWEQKLPPAKAEEIQAAPVQAVSVPEVPSGTTSGNNVKEGGKSA